MLHRLRRPIPFAAIEAIIPWEQYTASVAQAEKLSRGEAFDPLALLTDYFSTLRKHAPAFLEAFQFRGAPVAQSLLDAIDLLRTMNRTGARNINCSVIRSHRIRNGFSTSLRSNVVFIEHRTARLGRLSAWRYLESTNCGAKICKGRTAGPEKALRALK